MSTHIHPDTGSTPSAASCNAHDAPRQGRPAEPAAGCHRDAATTHAGHGHHGHATTPGRLATSATIHCLTGCAIGEFIGLAIGVSLGLGAWPTMILATALAYLSGFALGLRPLVKRGMTIGEAFRTIWLGEAISIAVMEVAMNFTDYHVGGVTATTVFAPMFWAGFALALPAGFVVAWPVNWWLLKRQIKAPCH